MAHNPFQQKQQEADLYRERDPSFDLYLRGAESRCKFERWKTKLGWILSELELQKEIKACKELLRLAREIESNGYSFDRKITKEEIKKLKEEKKTIPKIINLIEQLDELYNNPESRVDNKGYPNICLAALAIYPMPITGETIRIEVAGYLDSSKKLVSNLIFQKYSMSLQTELQKVYGSNGAFYQLLNTISDILENRYTELIQEIKKTISTTKTLFEFEKFNEIVEIFDTDELNDKENEHCNIEKSDQKVMDWTPQHEKPEKVSMPKLTNNPFQAIEVFAGLSSNVSDMPKRFLHLDQVVAFGSLGLRFIKYKGGKKHWFTIRLKKENEKKEKKDYSHLYKLSPYYHLINDLINRTEVTNKEQIALQIIKVELTACIRNISSIIYAVITYMLGFKPVRKGGGSLDDITEENLD